MYVLFAGEKIVAKSKSSVWYEKLTSDVDGVTDAEELIVKSEVRSNVVVFILSTHTLYVSFANESRLLFGGFLVNKTAWY